MPPRPAVAGASLLCALALPPCLPGQEAEVACPDGRISGIFIDNHSVFDPSDPGLNPRFDWAYRLVNRLHVRTREEVIQREILVEEGDCYDIERLRDSERLVRSLDFIAKVDIFGVRQPDGSFHVVVDTRDEWSTRVEPRIGSAGGMRLSGLRLREDNLLGTGNHVSAFYLDREEEQVYGITARSPQLLGTRWRGEVEGGRTSVGTLFFQSVMHPFVGQVGRWAAGQAVLHHDRNFEYWVPHEGRLVAVWLPERRRSLAAGTAYRWGTHGYNRTLLGAALSGEWVSYPAPATYGRDPDPELLPAGVPEIPVDTVSSVRASLMVGQRNVYFVRRRALDTVNGTEDVRLGVETEVSLGPSLPRISASRDVAFDLAFFAGGELGARILAGTQLLLEGRRNYEAPPDRSEWNDVFGQFNGWAYWRPSLESRHTLVASLAAAGGWHNVTPFQLTLGGSTGLRGYDRHVHPGARRVVASLEQRSHLGWPLPELFDLGAVAFVDAGRIWPGAAPFGVASPLRMSVGGGLRVAFPPGSRQTFRLDVGVPVFSVPEGRRMIVSVGVGQVTGRSALRRDPQLGRSMRYGASTSTFVFATEP